MSGRVSVSNAVSIEAKAAVKATALTGDSNGLVLRACVLVQSCITLWVDRGRARTSLMY